MHMKKGSGIIQFHAELFLEVYSAFCKWKNCRSVKNVEGILRSYVNDYCQDMMEQRICGRCRSGAGFCSKISL